PCGHIASVLDPSYRPLEGEPPDRPTRRRLIRVGSGTREDRCATLRRRVRRARGCRARDPAVGGPRGPLRRRERAIRGRDDRDGPGGSRVGPRRVAGGGARDGGPSSEHDHRDAAALMFGWTYLDGTGEEVGRSPSFGDPEAAEDWIGVSWRDLADNGVEE